MLSNEKIYDLLKAKLGSELLLTKDLAPSTTKARPVFGSLLLCVNSYSSVQAAYTGRTDCDDLPSLCDEFIYIETWLEMERDFGFMYMYVV